MDQKQPTEKTTVSLRRLLETLELASGQVPPATMGAILEQQFNMLLTGLAYYKSPSEDSKKQLMSGKVKWRAKEYKVDDKQRDFILKISSTLRLDEVQSFEIFQSYLRTELRGQTFEYNDDRFYEVIDFYFDERSCLLNIICSLFRNGDDENHLYYHEASTITAKLLDSGISKKIISQYTALSETPVPKHLESPLNVKWANQCVYEQAACLEIIFLLYYTRVACPPAQQLELMKLFQSNGFGTKQPNYTLLTEGARKTINRISSLCIIILIEAFNLESFQESESKHTLLTDDGTMLLNLEKELSTWGTLPHHGPILLSWASLICRLHQLGHSKSKDLDYRIHGMKAVQLRAMEYLHRMLTEVFSTDDPNLTGYKSVIKGFVTSVLSAFTASHLPDYNMLVMLYCEIFTGQSGLCRQFWEQDIYHEALRSLLDTTKARFPLVEFEPFVRILIAVSGDPECARTTFNYLRELKSFSQPLESFYKNAKAYNPNSVSTDYCEIITGSEGTHLLTRLTSLGKSSTMIRLTKSTTIHDGFTLPPGTLGYIVSSVQDLLQIGHDDMDVYGFSDTRHMPANLDFNQSAIIQWKFTYSAWRFFLVILDTFIKRVSGAMSVSTEHISTLKTILLLIEKLLQNDATLALYIDDHFLSEYPSFNDDGMIARLFMIFQHGAFLPSPPMELLTACIKCINGYATSQPAVVWAYMKRSGLLEDAERTSRHTNAVRHILLAVECPMGYYPVTLAFLELLTTLLPFMQMAPLSNAQSSLSSEFFPCLSYLRTDILASYENWRYTRLLERWEIGIKVMSIFNTILMDVPVTTREREQVKKARNMSVRESLLESLLYDSSFHHALLNIVGTGTKALESLFNSRKVKEAQTLEMLVVIGLTVLERVLLAKEGGISSLEHSIFTRTRYVGKENITFILILATYIHYTYNVQLPLIATRLLTILCGIPLDDKSLSARYPSIIGYLTNHTSSLQSNFLSRLKDARENEDLRVSILRLVIQALDTQPGLADLFLNGPSTVLEERKVSKHSILHVILSHVISEDATKGGHSYRVVAESVHLLECLWQAPEYNSLISTIREYKNFWNQMVKLLELNTGLSDINAFPYQLLTQQYILNTIACEVYYTSTKTSFESPLEPLMSKVNSLHLTWMKQLTSFPFEPKLRLSLEAQAKALHIELDSIQDKNISGSNEMYTYDIAALDQKLSGFKGTEVDSLFVALQKINKVLLEADIKLKLLKSWKALIQITILRQPRLLTEDLIAKLVEGLTSDLRDQKRDGLIVELVDQEIANIILLLVSHWTVTSSEKRDWKSVIPIVNSLCVALQRIITATFSHDTLNAIFTSAHFLLRSIPTAHWNDITEQALEFAVQACNSLSKPLVRTVCISLLDVVVANMPETDTRLVQYFQNNDTYAALIQLLALCMQDLQTPPTFTSALVYLLLTLSQNQYTAEALAVNGIMMTLSNDSLSIFQEIAQPYNQAGERNRWHRTWCMLLSIITSMLRTLGHSERFLEQCLEFANIHQARLMAVMNPSILTIGSLEETERITGFLYQISHYSERWRLVSNALASKLQQGIIQLIQHYVLLLLQPNLLARAAHPVSKEEKRVDTATPDSSLVPFSQLVEQHIFIVLRNALSIIRLLTPNPLANRDQEWEHWTPLFTFSLETSLSTPASLGILLACLNVCLMSLRKLTSPEGRNSRESAEIRSLLLFIMENCLYIILPHILYAINTDAKQRIRDEVGSELESFLSRLNRDLGRFATSAPATEKHKESYMDSLSFFKQAEGFVKVVLQ